MSEPLGVTVIVDDEADALARDALILTVPGVQAEVDRYTPVVEKLTDISLLAIIVACERETRRRAAKLRRPVGIGNRSTPTRHNSR